MKYIIYFMMMLYGSLCHAIVCKHIVERSETNTRKVYQIQRDALGYMWFMNHAGISRFDGTKLKHYKLPAEGRTMDYYMGNCRLLTDNRNGLWVVTRNGYLWMYNPSLDKFECRNHLVIPNDVSLHFLCVDNSSHIWFSVGNRLIAYQILSNTFHRVDHSLATISCMVEVAPGEYFVGSDEGLFGITIKNYAVDRQTGELSGKRCSRIHEILFHPYTQRLVVFDYSEGLGVWDMKSEQLVGTWNRLLNSRVSGLRIWDDRTVLVATDGEGIFRMDIVNPDITSFIQTDFENDNSIRTNRIADVFVDDQKLIWVADYPEGVSMIDVESPDDYKWYRARSGDSHSLTNNRVNAVLHDSDGDVWFATDHGISCFHPSTGLWNRIVTPLPCQMYTALCEVKPEEICAGNYVHGLFFIRKKSNYSVTPYVRISGVNALCRKDKDGFWIGTDEGVFFYCPENDSIVEVKRLSGLHIHALHQSDDCLYIGTEGNGLMVYHPEHEQMDTVAALGTGNVYAVWSDDSRRLMGSSDGFAFSLDLVQHSYYRFLSKGIRITSGTFLGNGRYILGTYQGAIEYDKQEARPLRKACLGFYLDELRVLDKEVTVETENSPLKKALNCTATLQLEHNENTFSFTATAIRYTEKQDIAYSWKLDHTDWSTPSVDNRIRFSNLPPGEYIFSVRALSIDNGRPFAQRNMHIIIRQPLWKTGGAFLCYGLLALMLGSLAVRSWFVWQDRNLSREQVRLFANTTRNLCLPLTLIKVPLEYLYEKSSSELVSNVLQQIKGVNNLLAELENISRVSAAPGRLSLADYELSIFLKETVARIRDYISEKDIMLRWTEEPAFATVCLDKDKMSAILRNLLMAFTDSMDRGGEILLSTSCNNQKWELRLESEDNGFLKKKF